MPFESDRQRRFMWAKHPEIAQRWTDEGKGYVAGRGRRRAAGQPSTVKRGRRRGF